MSIGDFKQRLRCLHPLDKYIIAVKFKKDKWDTPDDLIRPSHEDILSRVKIHGSKYELELAPINPIDPINMIWHDDSYFLLTKYEYHNRFSGRINPEESSILREFLGTHINYQVYYGERRLTIKTKTPPNQQQIDEINQKWDCQDSAKIQDWYYENNSQYRNEIDLAGGRKEKVKIDFYEEIFLSNMQIEEIKEVAQEYMQALQDNNGFLPEGQLFIHNEETKIINKTEVNPFPSGGIYIEQPLSDMMEQEYNYSLREKEIRFRQEHPYENLDDYSYIQRLQNGQE